LSRSWFDASRAAKSAERARDWHYFLDARARLWRESGRSGEDALRVAWGELVDACHRTYGGHVPTWWCVAYGRPITNAPLALLNGYAHAKPTYCHVEAGTLRQGCEYRRLFEMFRRFNTTTDEADPYARSWPGLVVQ
jgi:hypothetical protein